MGQIFRRAEKYLDQIDSGSWLEIGSSRRGDDGSTRVISEWATVKDSYLDTVDADPRVCDAVRRLNLNRTTVINQTGEEYLKNFLGSGDLISFLYLDNFDWDWHPLNTEVFVQDQIVRYQSLGLEMNNVNCQAAHLNQSILASRVLTERSLIVCDDTWFFPGWGVWCGKSGAAVPYLLSQGFRVLETEEYPVYGTILGRGF
jgi:hypothetical protein